MPSHHRFLAEWSPERFQTWSAKMGPATAELVGLLLQSREHPEQSFRACLGILQGLPRKYGPVRVEAACARALAVGGHSYRSVASILDRSLDQQPLPGAPVEFPSCACQAPNSQDFRIGSSRRNGQVFDHRRVAVA